MDALLRRRAMIAAGGGSPTPPGPVTTAYIRGGADGSYIDTGITADNTVKVIVWARNWNPASGFLFGSRTSAGVNAFSLYANDTSGTGRIRLDYAQTNNTFADDQFTNLSHYRKYEFYNGTLSINGVVVATATSGTFSNSQAIHICGLNNGGTHTSMSLPVDICACKIYKNNVLVRNYTAVNTPSIGLYDSISGTMFTNAGSGIFSYGTFAADAYAPLEYIECSGSQYFDAGIKGTNLLDFVCKIRPNITANYAVPFACQTSGSSKRYGFMFGNATTKGSEVYFSYAGGSLNYNNGTSLNGSDYVVVKKANVFSLYKNKAQVTTKSATSSTYTTDYNIFVGARNNAGTIDYPFQGMYYYAGFGTSRNFVPAKVNGVSGLYDTYNDVFYPSTSGTAFIAGQEI